MLRSDIVTHGPGGVRVRYRSAARGAAVKITRGGDAAARFAFQCGKAKRGCSCRMGIHTTAVGRGGVSVFGYGQNVVR